MAFIDYYQVLGIAKTATADEIKKAYRKLARQFHPDTNPNDEQAKQKFQQINEANEVLSNVENRKKYDAYGENWKHGEEYEKARQQQQYAQSQSGNSWQDTYSGNYDDGTFSDFFGDLFGSRSRKANAAYRGQDVEAALTLSLRQAYTTSAQSFTINGQSLRITVPAGIADKQKIKLAGKGMPGANGGPAGDLYITIKIEDDVEYTRLKNDLYKTQEIDLYTAVLGGHTLVSTLDGKQLKVPVAPGTQNGLKQRLKGKGFPVYKKEGEFGDLYISFLIKIPQNLSTEEIDLFTQLAAIKNK